MRRLLLPLIFALAAPGQQPAVQQPAGEQPVFRAGVSYVRVDAQVVDVKQVVANLEKEDFRILDEGVPQAIEYFGRETEPLWVVLLLDVSGSMTRYLDDMAAAAGKALRALGSADQVAVMFFGRRTRVAQEFTSSFDQAAAAVKGARRERSVGSGTEINSAVIDAARLLRSHAENKPGRRAIVILTDNEMLNYKVTDEMTVEALYEADTVLNAITTPKSKPPEPVRPGVYANPDFTPPDVFKLARQSGGEVLRAARGGEALQEMISRIRTRYSLHYRAPEATPGAKRRIQVELSPEARKRHAGAEVRARAGYMVPR